MKRFDQIIGAYYSDEVEVLKKKAWGSFVLSVVAGVSAVVLFMILAATMFLALVFQFNPLRSPLLLVLFVIGVPALLILIPTSWAFSFRYLWSCKQAKDAVDRSMRQAIRSDAGGAVVAGEPDPGL